MTCSSARYLLVAGFAGVAAASLSGTDLIGLLAAVLAVLLVAALERVDRRRSTRRSCAVPEDVDVADREPTRR